MNDREVIDALKKVAGALAETQAANLANSYILFELVRDLADLGDDRHKYFSSLFERVSARADRTPVEQESNPLVVAFRAEIARFFEVVARSPR